MYADQLYTLDHRAVHNGVGDYEMVCPVVGGHVAGFIPYMLRTSQTKCAACGRVIRFEQEEPQ